MLLRHYPLLDLPWWEATTVLQNNCYKTFNKLPITVDKFSPHRAGIHNEGLTDDHLKVSTVIDPIAMNVPEHDILKTANVTTVSKLWIRHASNDFGAPAYRRFD